MTWNFNPSFDFVDAYGKGYCQPDVMLELPDRTLVIEVKLSQTWYGDEQILKLYKPVVEHFTGKPVVAVQMFRNIKKKSERRVSKAEDLWEIGPGEVWQWHWYG